MANKRGQRRRRDGKRRGFLRRMRRWFKRTFGKGRRRQPTFGRAFVMVLGVALALFLIWLITQG